VNARCACHSSGLPGRVTRLTRKIAEVIPLSGLRCGIEEDCEPRERCAHRLVCGASRRLALVLGLKPINPLSMTLVILQYNGVRSGLPELFAGCSGNGSGPARFWPGGARRDETAISCGMLLPFFCR